MDMVASFCYLGDMISIDNCCELVVSTHVQMARETIRELLPALTIRYPSYKSCGHVAMRTGLASGPPILHASETWPLTKLNLQHLEHMAGP